MTSKQRSEIANRLFTLRWNLHGENTLWLLKRKYTFTSADDYMLLRDIFMRLQAKEIDLKQARSEHPMFFKTLREASKIKKEFDAETQEMYEVLHRQGEDPFNWAWIECRDDMMAQGRQSLFSQLPQLRQTGKKFDFEIFVEQYLNEKIDSLVELGLDRGDFAVFLPGANSGINRHYTVLVRATDNNVTTVKLAGHDLRSLA
jgi:hypothetical protein